MIESFLKVPDIGGSNEKETSANSKRANPYFSYISNGFNE